jgi:BirA family biotin operon repressor/biotin-[acetyl-CoA-carboxylase] ligase
MNFTILRFDTLESTNNEARDQAKVGAAEGLCIVARQQTAGRGRNGRNWVSEKDAGLFFSIILRPKLDAQYLPLITFAAGIAAYDSLASLGLEPDIKWVNDILINGKKICGILAETVETPKGLAVVLGIGINLRSYNFPPEIADTATSIEAETLQRADPNLVLEKFTKRFSDIYHQLSSSNGSIEILELWTERSSYENGKQVMVKLEHETFEGTTEGLEPNGALRVRVNNGDLRIVTAGDVKKLRSAD